MTRLTEDTLGEIERWLEARLEAAHALPRDQHRAAVRRNLQIQALVDEVRDSRERLDQAHTAARSILDRLDRLATTLPGPVSPTHEGEHPC